MLQLVVRNVKESRAHMNQQVQQAVVVTDVRHAYRNHPALQDVSFALQPGTCGLLGPNGAGKSTLIRLLATTTRLQSGSISVFGHELGSRNEMEKAQAFIGYLPQTFGFFPGFSVREFVTYFAILRGVTAEALDDAVTTALTRVDLADRADEKMKRLSGGMVRRAGIAQAIVHRPGVLLLDEPTSGLDPDQRHHLRQTLHELAKDSTIMISTHLSEDIAALGGKVIVLRDGAIRFEGTAEDLATLGTKHAPDTDDLRTPLERGYSMTQTMATQ